jgi:hypothetical protein
MVQTRRGGSHHLQDVGALDHYSVGYSFGRAMIRFNVLMAGVAGGMTLESNKNDLHC